MMNTYAALLLTSTNTPLSLSSPSGSTCTRCGRNCRQRSTLPRTFTPITKSKPFMSNPSPCLSMILAGVETPAAATTPPSSLPVSLIHWMVSLTAEAIESVSETSAVKNRAREGPSCWTTEAPVSALRSRIAALPPAARIVWTVARPRPEALEERALESAEVSKEGCCGWTKREVRLRIVAHTHQRRRKSYLVFSSFRFNEKRLSFEQVVSHFSLTQSIQAQV